MATEYSNLHYISFHLGDKKAREFGSARLAGYLMDMWMSKKLVLPGIEYSTIPPGLSAEELAAIPHAEIAMGQFDRLTLSSCVRGTGKSSSSSTLCASERRRTMSIAKSS